MKLRKVLSLFVALVMMFEVLPLSSLATEIADATENVEVAAEAVEEETEEAETEVTVEETDVSDESDVASGNTAEGVLMISSSATRTASLAVASVSAVSSSEASESATDEANAEDISEENDNSTADEEKVDSDDVADDVTVDDETISDEETVEDVTNEYLIATVSEDSTIIDSGTCGADGDNLTWVLTSDGTLTISGEGEMEDYASSSYAPWFYYNYDYSYKLITSIIVLDGVTSVGNYAFFRLYGLEQVSLPSTLTTIGNYSFDSCYSLESVILPDNLVSIGNRAFQKCSLLSSFDFPDSLTTLGNYVFDGCKCLTEIYIPSTITMCSNSFYGASIEKAVFGGDVPDYSFSWCTSLTEVVFEGDLSCIGTSAFQGCSSLSAINLPEGLISIGSRAFSGCSSLTTLKLPNGLTTIEEYAFYECTSLISVDFPESLTTIKAYTFYGCTSLSGVEFPDNITTLEYHSFSNCSSLTSITIRSNITSCSTSWYNGPFAGSSVETVTFETTIVPAYIFSNCTSLTTVIFADKTTEIGSNAFYGCSSLVDITLPESLTVIGKYAFYNCSSLENVQLSCNLETIEPYAFSCCVSLSRIELPDSLISIENNAFTDCTALNEIKLPDNLSYLGFETFTGCYSLTEINLPLNIETCAVWNGFGGIRSAFTGSGVTTVICEASSVPSYAFYGCDTLTTVVFTGNTTTISGYAFGNCTALAEIELPDSLISIGGSAFYGCSNLKEINLPADLASAGSAFEDSFIETVICEANEIPSFTFYECTTLKNVKFTGVTTTIGMYAFYGCTALSDVILPDTLTTIDLYAFKGCTSLVEIILSDSLTTLGGCVFSGCTNLTEIVIPNSLTSCSETGSFKDSSIETVYCDTLCLPAYIFKDCTTLTNVVFLRDTEEIGDYAFSGCTSLEELVLPDSITSLGIYIFSGATQLKSITIPQSTFTCGNATIVRGPFTDSSIETVRYEASTVPKYTFVGCQSLTEILFTDNLTEINLYAFRNCVSLNNVEFSGNLIEINSYAFSGCTALSSIELPDGVTKIDDYAFKDCTSLSDINIPDTVSYLGYYIFSGCTSLLEINIPSSLETVKEPLSRTSVTTATISDGLVTVPSHTFYSCTSLITLYVPSSVKEFGSFATYNCTSLTDVYYDGTVSEWNLITISSIENDPLISAATIYCTDGYIEGEETTYFYDSGDSGDEETSSYSVYYLASYDEATGVLAFDIEVSPSVFTLASDVNTTGISDMVGSFVMITKEQDEDNVLNYTVTSIVQVESAIGEVTKQNGSYVTIDGTTYHVNSNLMVSDLVGTEILYFVYGGTIVYYSTPKTLTGMLEVWNLSTSTVTIDITEFLTDPRQYLVASITDLSFLADIENYLDHKVTFTVYTISYCTLVTKIERYVEPNEITVSQNSEDDVLMLNQSMQLTAEITLNTVYSTDSITWKTSDSSVVAFDRGGTSSVTHDIDTTNLSEPSQLTNEVTIYGISTGSAVLTCELASGTSFQFKVVVYDDNTLAIEKLANDWYTAYQTYMDELEKAMVEMLGTVSDSTIEQQAEALMKADESSDDKLITFTDVGTSDSVKKIVYQAVAQFLADESTNEIDLGSISTSISDASSVVTISAKVVNAVYNSIQNINESYTINGHTVIINDGANYLGAYMAKISYDGKYVAQIVSTRSQLNEVITAYVQELVTLEENAIDEVYKQMAKSVFGKSINSLEKEQLTKLISPYTSALANSGLGKVDTIIANCLEYYKYASKLMSCAQDPSKLMTIDLSSMKSVDFGDDIVTKKTVKSAVKGLDTAQVALNKAVAQYQTTGSVTTEDVLSNWFSYASNGIKSIFKCPVNITVYDSNGNQVGYVGDDDLWFDEDVIYIICYGDAKTIYSNGEALSFEIEGTDYGTLSCTFEEYSDNEAVSRINYYDISLYNGKILSAQTADSNLTTSNTFVAENGTTIQPSEIITADEYADADVVVSLTSEGGEGVIYGYGEYVRGDNITVYAIADDGYKFMGWKNSEDGYVSISSSYEFTARNDVSLTAVFTSLTVEKEDSSELIDSAEYILSVIEWTLTQSDVESATGSTTADKIATLIDAILAGLGIDSNVTITYTITDITEAIAGDATDVDGTDGSFTINFAISAGSESDTLTETGTITATAYVHIHSLIHVEVVDATCTAEGNTEYWYCSGCDKYYSDENAENEITLADTVTAKIAHNYEAVVTDPTCTEGGYTTYTCSVCKDSYVADETAALGHDYTSEVTKEATCTEAGVMTYTCTRGDDSYTVEIPATGHTEAEAVVENEVAATCTTDGSYDSVVYCSDCGEELSRETIVVPAAHTAGTAVRENVVEATRTTEGSYDLVTYCTVCGEEISRETVTVPATGVDMITVWLRTPADYSAVNNAIAKANALNSDDYTNFSDVTDAINAVNWTYNALMQSYVNEMAEKIETAIANLIPVGTTIEEVEIQEPIEDTNTDTEDDGEESSESSEPETNPTTGIAISLLPMMIAALAAASSKRR